MSDAFDNFKPTLTLKSSIVIGPFEPDNQDMYDELWGILALYRVQLDVYHQNHATGKN